MRAFAIRSRIKPPHMGLLSQFVIVLLVVALMGAMAIEPARQLLEQRRRIAAMKQDLKEVQTTNLDLKDRIKRLNDPDFVEQRAREQIGLVREGEITYVVMPPSKPAKARMKKKEARHARKAETPAAAVPESADREDPGLIGGILDLIDL